MFGHSIVVRIVNASESRMYIIFCSDPTTRQLMASSSCELLFSFAKHVITTCLLSSAFLKVSTYCLTWSRFGKLSILGTTKSTEIKRQVMSICFKGSMWKWFRVLKGILSQIDAKRFSGYFCIKHYWRYALFWKYHITILIYNGKKKPTHIRDRTDKENWPAERMSSSADCMVAKSTVSFSIIQKEFIHVLIGTKGWCFYISCFCPYFFFNVANVQSR